MLRITKSSAMGVSEVIHMHLNPPIQFNEGDPGQFTMEYRPYMDQPWMTVFAEEGGGGEGGEGEGDGAAAAAAAATAEAAAAAAAADPPKTFDQDAVNKLVAKEKREGQLKTQKAIDELNSLKTRTTLNDEERTTLDTTIEALQNDLLTRDEQQRRAKEKAEKEHNDAIGNAEEKHTKLFKTYRAAETGRSVTDAAVTGKAIRPSQIVAILAPMTKFVEIKDEEEKPTGKFKTVIEFPDKDKDGKDVVMNFTATEAVNRMKEMEDYFNLFEGDGTGGIGGNNRQQTSGKKGDPVDLAKTNPKEYIKQRREGKLPVPK